MNSNLKLAISVCFKGFKRFAIQLHDSKQCFNNNKIENVLVSEAL